MGRLRKTGLIPAAGREHAATATEERDPATADRRPAHAAIPRGGAPPVTVPPPRAAVPWGWRAGIIPGGHPDPAAARGGDTASTVTRMRPSNQSRAERAQH